MKTKMSTLKRNAVFVALQGTIGRELVFKHYTSKVVAAVYPDLSNAKTSEKTKRARKK
jgi:hypothetical protein